jgi:hypothetical protein
LVQLVPEIATVVRIINDETVEINYEAPKIENDIGEQPQVVDGVKDEFDKNKDVEHHDANVSNDIEHET